MDRKIYALKPSFIEKLHNIWKEDYSSTGHEAFLNTINQEYGGANLKQYVLPGDNGLYIDEDMAFRLNKLRKVGSETNWDYEASRMLFMGTGNGFGIYQLDSDGRKIPLDMIYATDTRIWNYLSLFRLNEYTARRWGNSKDSQRIFINSLTNRKQHGIQ